MGIDKLDEAENPKTEEKEKDLKDETEIFDLEALTSSDNEFYHDRTKLSLGLKQRHLQMIALVNVFGTGIFLSSGGILATTGPLGTVLGYGICAVIVGMNQMAMAEVCCLMPTSSAVIRHVEHFWDPAMAFAFGYCSLWDALVPNELVATAVLVSFWTDLSASIWISILMVLIFALNFLPIRWYGEVEFFFASIKMILLVVLMTVSLIITCGGGPSSEPIGFRFWRDPGPMVSYLIPGALGRLAGFMKSFSSGVVYSYGGVQSVATLAAECKYPRRTIFRAAKRVLYRVAILMFLAAFSITMIIGSDNKAIANSSGNAKSSPFVIAMQSAGISVLPHFVNATVLSSAFSTGNQSVCYGARNLFALAVKGQAPRIFLKTTKNGVPWVGVIFVSMFMPLSFMTLSSGASEVFAWFQNITSARLLYEWVLMSVNHITMTRAMKIQGYTRDQLPYSSIFTPYFAWISGLLSAFLLFVSGFKNFIHGHFEMGSFFSCYFIIPLVIILYTGFKMIKRTRIIKPEEVELESLFQDVAQNPEPPFPELKGWSRLTLLWS